MMDESVEAGLQPFYPRIRLAAVVTIIAQVVPVAAIVTIIPESCRLPAIIPVASMYPGRTHRLLSSVTRSIITVELRRLREAKLPRVLTVFGEPSAAVREGNQPVYDNPCSVTNRDDRSRLIFCRCLHSIFIQKKIMPKIFVYFPLKILWVTFLISLIGGCGGGPKKPDGLPKLFPMTITLMQDGAPLADAVVTLVPASGTMQWGSGGYSDAQGKAVIKTHGDFPGAPAGNYKVTVLKREIEKSGGEGNFTEYYLVESLYEAAETTPLQVEVGSETKEAEFDVGQSIRKKVK